jgi:hypothetical protein
MGVKRRKSAEEMTLAEHLRSIAAKGGKARMESMTEEQRRLMARKGGVAGGEARKDALTIEQRSEIARKAATARWAKRRKKAKTGAE